MGYILWLLIPSCQWRYRLWFRNMWCVQHPLTIKCTRVKWNVTHNMRALRWQNPGALQIIADKALVTLIEIGMLTAAEKVSYQLDTFVGKKLLSAERRVVFRAELPQNKWLANASIFQVQPPSSMIGKVNITCCTPVLVEEDRELRSRSNGIFTTYLLLRSLVPIAWIQARVHQPNMHNCCRWLWWWRTGGSF